MSVEKKLSNSELRGMVDGMIELHTLLKHKRAEVKQVAATYKETCEIVKKHMIDNDVTHIDKNGYQINTYSRTREAAMNSNFISTGLEDFFKENKIGGNATAMANQASEYLVKRKKGKGDGTQVWTTTIRARKEAKKKAEGKTTARTRKRKRSTETMILDDPAPAAEQRNVVDYDTDTEAPARRVML
jgi:hypothetical protein